MTMASQPAIRAVDPRALRRAQPLNQALPSTMRWIAALPLTARPHALLRDFPRVANTLARNRADPASLAACLDELLRDARGGRRGFPADVHAELIALREYEEGRAETLPVHGAPPRR